MEKNKVEITFHSVGQGLFCSGKINDLNFVYDCGSSSGSQFIKKAVSDYWNVYRMDENKINLLVISHFHRDHVNGLQYLLDKNKQIDILCLPYYNKFERLFFAYSLDEFSSDSEMRWYYEFLIDPLKTILGTKAKIEKIIFFRNNTKNSRKEEINDSNDDFIDEFYSDEKLRNQVLLEESEIYNRKNIFYKKTSKRLKAKVKTLEFLFYNKKLAFNGFRKINDIIKGKNISDVLMDNITVCKLREIYNKSLGNSKKVNDSSLLMLFKLNSNQFEYSYTFLKYLPNHEYEHKFILDNNKITISTFLFTGDATLSFAFFKLLLIHFKITVDYLDYLQIPHHGSRKSIDNQVLLQISNIKSIVSAGVANNYGHPSPNVLKWLNRCYWANECTEIQVSLVSKIENRRLILRHLKAKVECTMRENINIQFNLYPSKNIIL